LRQSQPQASRPPKTPAWALAFALLVLGCVLVLPSDGGSDEPFAAKMERLRRFLAGFGSPDFSSAALAQGVELSLQTLAIAVIGSVIGIGLGYLLGLGASRAVLAPTDSRRPGARVLVGLCRLLLDILRGVPDFAWALLILTVPGPGPVTGVLAIGLSMAGILGKIYSEIWDGVSPRRYALVPATGAGRLTTFAFGIQPLAARAMLSYTLMRFECTVRNASVIGVVGGGGLGAQLFDEFTFGNYPRVVTLLCFLLGLTALVDLASNILRAQLDLRSQGSPALSTTRRRRRGAVLVVTGLIAWSAYHLTPAMQIAAEECGRIDVDFIRNELGQLLVPDLSPATLSEALASVRVPLAMAILGTLVGALLALLLTLPASLAMMTRFHQVTGERPTPTVTALRGVAVVATRILAMIWRAVPTVAWLLIFAAFFTIGVVPGVLALSVHSAGILLRVYTERVDDVDSRVLERNFTGSRLKSFAYVAAPLSFRDWLAYTSFQFESNVRAGLVLGIIGVGGLGDAFHSSLTHWNLHRASTFLLVMVVLATLIDRSSRALDLTRK
jgi:phosphonate transport system permease protein